LGSSPSPCCEPKSLAQEGVAPHLGAGPCPSLSGTGGRRRTAPRLGVQCEGFCRRRRGDGMALGPELVTRPGRALPRGTVAVWFARSVCPRLAAPRTGFSRSGRCMPFAWRLRGMRRPGVVPSLTPGPAQ
jgi:hypothetical protein